MEPGLAQHFFLQLIAGMVSNNYYYTVFENKALL